MPTIEEAINNISPYLDNKFPRNIVSICEKLKIQVKETKEFPEEVSGLIYKDKDTYCIIVNSTHTVGRKSFTIAHELGHYFLHRDILDRENEIVSGSKGIDTETHFMLRSDIGYSSQEYRQQETEANKFAAELLMPREVFIEKCKELNSIDDVADYFGVSISAATIRADRLGGLYFL